MDDLLADFVAESREMLEALAGEMVAWEAEPADRARLDNIFRFFHTVKGNCGFFDYEQLETLSHAAEDALSEVRGGKRSPDTAFVNAVLAVIDRISDMIDAIDAGQPIPAANDEMLIAALAGTGELEEASAPNYVPSASDDFAGQTRSPALQRSIRLPVELLDRVMSGVSDMVLARNELARRIQDLGGESGLESPFNRLSTILTEVRDAITRTRMQRIETLFTGFPRLVRDLSAELGKQVMVEIQGGDVELDREMIEMIRDPLVHIIRNAVDHGIETPTERRAGGKREIGLLRISARQSGNQIRIGISDDGRGIDTARLVEKSIAAGTLTAEEAARLSEADRNMLICQPGVSTADAVTSVSGRGVGMDVVRANIEKIGGSLQIYSTRGVDTRILLNLPLTLSIVPALTVRVQGQRFAVPRSYVEEIFQISKDEKELIRAGGREFVTIRDQRFACADMGAALGLEETPIRAGRVVVLVRLMVGDPFAFAVDKVLDHQELVIKPIAPVLMETGLYVGTTQLEDGSPILMLDVPRVAEMTGVIRSAESGSFRQDHLPAAEIAAPTVPVLLFYGMDGKKRAIRMNTVRRVEEVEASALTLDGAVPHVVIDETLLPLTGMQGLSPTRDLVELFRLSDGETEIAYAFGEMIDTAEIDPTLTPIASSEDVAGIAMIEGEPVEVVDAHALFARHGRPVASLVPPVCRLPSNDRWLQEFLRPLVETAGYRVVDENDESDADVAISMKPGAKSKAATTELQAAQAIQLRTTKEPAKAEDGTIYRYDRDSLMAVLKAANAGRWQ